MSAISSTTPQNIHKGITSKLFVVKVIVDQLVYHPNLAPINHIKMFDLLNVIYSPIKTLGRLNPFTSLSIAPYTSLCQIHTVWFTKWVRQMTDSALLLSSIHLQLSLPKHARFSTFRRRFLILILPSTGCQTKPYNNIGIVSLV